MASKTTKAQNLLDNMVNKRPRHPKCLGFFTEDIGWGSEFDCGYDTTLDCEDCKYGIGRKDPEAKCNQPKKLVINGKIVL